MDWYIRALKKYAEFGGRAQRMEFWMFVLFNILISIGLECVDWFLTGGILSMLYGVAVLLPSIAVAIRRLHDTGRSGFWILMWFVPVIGWIVLLVFYCQDSTPGDNAFGPNPKTGAAAA